MKKSAFMLIELLVVIAILAILAILAGRQDTGTTHSAPAAPKVRVESGELKSRSILLRRTTRPTS